VENKVLERMSETSEGHKLESGGKDALTGILSQEIVTKKGHATYIIWN